ncbi:site-2 protease family protein [Paraburkholderia sp. SIMBA_054]|uniref:site-2 protease family protein n=1 Tax=Paraburkholderia sp. SIMBA_054 TaxID=3085795 RepID=UPI00397B141D
MSIVNLINAAWSHAWSMSPGYSILSALLAIPICYGAILGHELAHWTTARAFGLRGSIRFFPRRHVSRVWFLSVLGVSFDDAAFSALARWQARCIAAAGPVWDIAFAMTCLTVWSAVPGAVWIAGGVALAGVVYFFTSGMNIIPMPLRNDAWIFLWPESAIDDKAVLKSRPPLAG